MEINHIIKIFPWAPLMLLWSCTTTTHKLPQNPIDDPVILPEGMSQHAAAVSSKSIKSEDSSRNALFSLLIPAYGFSKNIELPVVIMPYLRYLLGSHDFYDTGKINPETTYHILEGGIPQIGYSNEEFFYNYRIAYQRIDILNDDFRNDLTMTISHRSNGDATYFVISNALSKRLTAKSAGFVGSSLAQGSHRIRGSSHQINTTFRGLSWWSLKLGVSWRVLSHLDLGGSFGVEQSLRGQLLSSGEGKWGYNLYGYGLLGMSFWW